jgi:hypothetical protein
MPRGDPGRLASTMRLTELHQDLSELRSDLAAELEAINRLE